LQGRSRNSQQSQAERQPRGRGHALESSFWSVALRTAQGGRSRNAKRPGALTGRSGGKCGLSLRCHPVKEAMLTAMAPRSEHSRRCPPRSWSLTCSRPVRTKRQDTHGSRDLRRAATVRVPPLARRLSGAAVGSRALPLKYRRAAERHPAPRLPDQGRDRALVLLTPKPCPLSAYKAPIERCKHREHPEEAGYS
jgi:hypothetical protein